MVRLSNMGTARARSSEGLSVEHCTMWVETKDGQVWLFYVDWMSMHVW